MKIEEDERVRKKVTYELKGEREREKARKKKMERERMKEKTKESAVTLHSFSRIARERD